MNERSSEMPAQDGQSMRFSDEVSVAEVARLLNFVRHGPGVVSVCSDSQSDETGMIAEWLR
jgi:hypothetical protein